MGTPSPLLVMTAVAIVCGGVVAARRNPPRADLVLWTFADSHARSYRTSAVAGSSLVDQFEQLTGKSVDVKLLNTSALNVRLAGIMDRQATDDDCPDLVEIEIGDIGRYFRAPADQVGFVPLDGYIDRLGWRERLIAARLAPWTHDGVLFGIPHDVHPVSITYRKDLFDQAGVDLAGARTWEEFHRNCLEFQQYWAARGYPKRRAMELPASSADYLSALLLARGVNLVEDGDDVRLADPAVARTIAFYARLVAGEESIAADATPGAQLWMRDFARGDLCALITPDWRAGMLKLGAPALSGKVAMMPLPRFNATDAPTSTWGGTMIGIPRASRHPSAAFELAMFLYSSPQGVEARWRDAMILPPVVDLWNSAALREPDPFFGGQRVGELYIELARRIPRRHVSPFSSIATGALASTLSRAVELAEDGASDAEIEAACRLWLSDAQRSLQRIVDFSRSEP